MSKGGGQREGGALKKAAVVTGGLVLAWITVEAAFKPFLERLRAAVSRSTDTTRDPDEEKAPTSTSAAVAAAVATAVAEEKVPDSAAAEPSAPPLPVEEEGSLKEGEDNEVKLEEKGEEALAAKSG